MLSIPGSLLEFAKQFFIGFLLGLNEVPSPLTIHDIPIAGRPLVYDETNDPYGIGEADASYQLNSRLVSCSENNTCPEYAQAVYLIGVILYVETDEENLWPEFSFDIPEAVNFFELAAQGNHPHANNELGIIHIEETDVRDFDKAEFYLNRALENDDFNAAYNLARLTNYKEPDQPQKIIEYMKQATEGGDPDMYTMLLHAFVNFGSNKDREVAQVLLKFEKTSKNKLLSDFESHFLTPLD